MALAADRRTPERAGTIAALASGPGARVSKDIMAAPPPELPDDLAGHDCVDRRQPAWGSLLRRPGSCSLAFMSKDVVSKNA
jgi:hypothetical protein